MDHIIDEAFKELPSPLTKTEVFVNTKSGSTVVLAFVFACDWWHIYEQSGDGNLRNWRATVGHKFRTEDEGRQFLLSRGWGKLEP